MCKKPLEREQAMREILRRLDVRKAWGGRWLLRHKAYSQLLVNCSDAQARAGNHVGAVLRTLNSLAWYPLPHRRGELRIPLERPRRLAVNVLRLLKVKRPDALAAKAPPAVNALSAQAKKGIVCVRASRVVTGRVGRNVELDDDKLGFVASLDKNPQKSRVLLRLALLKPRNVADMQRIFSEY